MTLERTQKPSQVALETGKPKAADQTRADQARADQTRADQTQTPDQKTAFAAMTPAQIQRARARFDRDSAALQRKVVTASSTPTSQLADQTPTTQLPEQQIAPAIQAKPQVAHSGFAKSPVQRRALEQTKNQSIQASNIRNQYQAAIVPETVQRLTDAQMQGHSNETRAAQTPNALNARTDWFNNELPVLRARHNNPDQPDLDNASVFGQSDARAKDLGKTYVAQRLSNGLSANDAASAIVNIQRRRDRNNALKGLLSAIRPQDSDYSRIQRLVAEKEQNLELQRRALEEGVIPQALQLAKEQANPTQANSGISDKIQAKIGGGSPLPEHVRSQLETGLNTDLSRVRVHTDGEADHLAKSVNAKAFTTGSDIFFSSGTFEPNTKTGYELIAHETTHTVQQALGQVKPGVDSDQGLEVDAQVKGAELAAKFDLSTKPTAQKPTVTNSSSSGNSTVGIQRLGETTQTDPKPKAETKNEVGKINTTPTKALETALAVAPVQTKHEAVKPAVVKHEQIPEVTAHNEAVHHEVEHQLPQLEIPTRIDHHLEHYNLDLGTHEEHHVEHHHSGEHSSGESHDTGVTLVPEVPEISTPAIQRKADPKQPQVTPEQAKAAGQQLIAAVTGAVRDQSQAVDAASQQHGQQIKQHAQQTATQIKSQASQHKSAVQTAFTASRAQAASTTTAAQSEIKGAVTTQQAALTGKTQTAVQTLQQNVRTKQTQTTQMASQEAQQLRSQSDQSLSSTDQKFQQVASTATQATGSGAGSSVAPEVGQAKGAAAQQMGADAAKDVNQAQSQTRATLQNQANQASSTLVQKGSQAAQQVGAVLPGAQAMLQSKAQQGKTQLAQMGSQASNQLTQSNTAVTQQLAQGQQKVQQAIAQTEQAHTSKVVQSSNQVANKIVQHAKRTNAATNGALQSFVAKASQGVDPTAVPKIASQITGKLGHARGQVQTGMQGMTSHATNAFQQGSSQAAQTLAQTSNQAKTTSAQATTAFKTQITGAKAKLIPATAQITNTVSQAQTQANAGTSSHLSTMTSKMKTDFGAGREKVVQGLQQDANNASSKANDKVTGELNAKISGGQEKIESKAAIEKSNLERQADGKDGQARAEQAQQTATTQRLPLQRSWLSDVWDWFGAQWDKLKSTFSSPSFWAGLVAGLVAAIIIVAVVIAIVGTGGLAAGGLLALAALGAAAGAGAGLAGTVAANAAHNQWELKPGEPPRPLFEGALKNTLLGTGGGALFAVLPATLPWIVGAGAAFNVGIGIYDNVQNGKPWYESLGADAIIGGSTALLSFGIFKGVTGTRAFKAIDNAGNTRFMEGKNPPELVKSPESATVKTEGNPNKQPSALKNLENDINTALEEHNNYTNKAKALGLPDDMVTSSADANIKNPTDKPTHLPRNRNADVTYKQAAKADPETRAYAAEVGREFDGKPDYRTNDDGTPGLKGRDRADEKIASYDGDASQLLDISGSRVVFKSLEQVYKALDYVRAKYDVVYFKDRFVSPVPSGFRDLLINIRTKNGHVVEFRLTTESIEAISKVEHKVYEKSRTIIDKLKAEKRNPTVEESDLLDIYNKELEVYKIQYDKAWEILLKEAKGKYEQSSR